MAVDAKDLPDVDNESWQGYQTQVLTDHADAKIASLAAAPQPAPTPMPTPADPSIQDAAPAAVEAAAPTPALEPEPVAPPNATTGQPKTATTPQIEAAAMPAWVPDKARVALGIPSSASGEPASLADIYNRNAGKTYLWGSAAGRTDFGNDPKGFDCSGFVAYALDKASGGAVKLPAYTDAIASSGAVVQTNNPQPGDVVLYKFNDPGQPGVKYPHTALYLGNGQVMQSGGNQNNVNTAAIDQLPGATFWRPKAADTLNLGDLTKLGDTVVSNVDASQLPDVDLKSWSRDQKQSLTDYAKQKVRDFADSAAAAPQSFIDYVGQKIDAFVKGATTGPAADAVIAASAKKPSEQTVQDVGTIAGVAATPIVAAMNALNPKNIGTTAAEAVTGAEGIEHKDLPSIPVLTGAADTAAGMTGPGGVLGNAAGPKAIEDYAGQVLRSQGVPAMAGAAAPLPNVALSGGQTLDDVVRAVNGGDVAKTPFGDKVQAIGQDVERLFADRYAPINRLGSPEAEAKVANYAGRSGSAMQRIEDGLGPVYKALDANQGKNQGLLEDFNAYVEMQHYLDVAKEKGTVFGAQDAQGNAIYQRFAPGGIRTTQQAQEVLDAIASRQGPENMAKIQEADGLRQEAMNSMLQDKVKAGFITQGDANMLMEKYPHYNPVSVLQAIESSNGGAVAGNKLSQVGNTIKRLTEEGSEADRMPAMQSAALALSQGQSNIMRNDAVSAVVDAAKVPVKRAVELRTGVDTGVGTRSVVPAHIDVAPGTLATVQDAVSQIKTLTRDLRKARMSGGEPSDIEESIAEQQARISQALREVAMPGTSKPGLTERITDPEILSKYAPREDHTFQRSPGAGGSSLTPAATSTLPKDVSLGRSAPEANKLATIMTGKQGDKPGEISFWKGGKRYTADFSSMPDVERSLKAMDDKGLPMAAQVAQVLNSPLRAGATTLSIPFQLRNALFDAIDAYTRAGIKPWGENGILKGYVSAWTKDAAYKRYIEGGGGMGGYFMREPNMGYSLLGRQLSTEKGAAMLERQVRTSGGITIESPGDVLRMGKRFGIDAATLAPIRHVGETIELGPRLARYGQALDRGATEAQAVMHGRRVTVDFSRMGDAMKVINAVIPFSNAALQGSLNIARSARDNPAKMAVRLGALTTAVASSYVWNRQFQDRYQDVPEYVKANSLVIMLPGGEPNANGQPGYKSNPYVAIPLREMGVLPYMITKALERMDGQNPDFGRALVSGVGALNPISGEPGAAGLLGAPGREFIQQLANYDIFRGRPVVSERLKNYQPGEQSTPQTSPAVTDMANLFNHSPLANAPLIGGDKSPVRMQRAIEDLTGGFGKTVLQGIDTAAGKQSDLPPVVGSVVTGLYRNYGGETEQRMYDQRDQRMEQLGQQYRDTLAAMTKNGANVGDPPKAIGKIELQPPEQAFYRERELAMLTQMLADSGLDDALSGLPNESKDDLAVRATILTKFKDAAGKIAAAETLAKIGEKDGEIENRLNALHQPDSRSLYPTKDYQPVGVR